MNSQNHEAINYISFPNELVGSQKIISSDQIRLNHVSKDTDNASTHQILRYTQKSAESNLLNKKLGGSEF